MANTNDMNTPTKVPFKLKIKYRGQCPLYNIRKDE